MTFWLLAAAIAAASFFTVALTASWAVASLAPAAARRFERYAAGSRAALLFRMRMLPAALGGLAAFGVALPVFLAYEPRNSEEWIPRTLLVLGAAGAALVIRGIWRAARAWGATRGVRLDWQSRGRRLDEFDTPLPVFAIDESFPTVAVVGVSRPAFFISERVLRECTRDEVRAMLLHESAHVAKGDNLKRFLMRACPDALGSGSLLDRAWSCAAEEAADAAAVAKDPAFALELAQALIRVARLAPSPTAPVLASAFYLGGSIESRVRRLVAPSPAADAPAPFAPVLVLSVGLCLAAAVFAAPLVYGALEALVHRLP